MGARFLGLALLCVLAGGCAGDVAVSNTGYTGTWSRGPAHAKSIVAIARVGDEYRFRWRKVSREPAGLRRVKLEVRCDWEGACVETLDGKKIAEHEFRTWTDPDSGHLMVEWVERRLDPKRRESRTVDELVVEPGGRVLWSYTIERDGQTFEGDARPRRSFTKVTDAIADPPAGAAS